MKLMTMNLPWPIPRISLADVGREPFRVFFPAGVVAGLTGVALWPLHFAGVIELYPGQNHARLMACGLFGAFIFGFLGTALPRLLSVTPLRWTQVLALLSLHLTMVAAFASAHTLLGDVLFLGLLVSFVTCLAVRFPQRKDSPPPGFILVGLAFACVMSGAVLSVVEGFEDLEPQWIAFQRLLSYQGFVLFPILGIGPFILPRFFGQPSAHNFPTTLAPSRPWRHKALLALGAGMLVLVSFVLEVRGSFRVAHGLRFLTVATYLLLEVPFRAGPKASSGPGLLIRTALVVLCTGFLAVAVRPDYRVSLLHLTLIGGFAVLTFVVATRVVFGHSGRLEQLKGRNVWLLVSVGLMLCGMATRISGDFLPHILSTHYSYGAVIWIVGVLIWSAFVLPKVLLMDPEP